MASSSRKNTHRLIVIFECCRKNKINKQSTCGNPSTLHCHFPALPWHWHRIFFPCCRGNLKNCSKSVPTSLLLERCERHHHHFWEGEANLTWLHPAPPHVMTCDVIQWCRIGDSKRSHHTWLPMTHFWKPPLLLTLLLFWVATCRLIVF